MLLNDRGGMYRGRRKNMQWIPVTSRIMSVPLRKLDMYLLKLLETVDMCMHIRINLATITTCLYSFHVCVIHFHTRDVQLLVPSTEQPHQPSSALSPIAPFLPTGLLSRLLNRFLDRSRTFLFAVFVTPSLSLPPPFYPSIRPASFPLPLSSLHALPVHVSTFTQTKLSRRDAVGGMHVLTPRRASTAAAPCVRCS
jgi:hypothetical protein